MHGFCYSEQVFCYTTYSLSSFDLVHHSFNLKSTYWVCMLDARVGERSDIKRSFKAASGAQTLWVGH